MIHRAKHNAVFCPYHKSQEALVSTVHYQFTPQHFVWAKSLWSGLLQPPPPAKSGSMELHVSAPLITRGGSAAICLKQIHTSTHHTGVSTKRGHAIEGAFSAPTNETPAPWAWAFGRRGRPEGGWVDEWMSSVGGGGGVGKSAATNLVSVLTRLDSWPPPLPPHTQFCYIPPALRGRRLRSNYHVSLCMKVCGWRLWLARLRDEKSVSRG